MPYSITTKDGITIQNIPDDIAQDADVLKQRVAQERAKRTQAPQEAIAPPIDPQAPVQATPPAQGIQSIPGVPQLTEFAAGVNRGAAGLLDIVPKGINQAVALAGGDPNLLPTFEQLTVPKGEFTEPGLVQDIAAGAGEAVPSAVAFGQALRMTAQQLPKLVSGAEGTLPGLLREAGKVTGATDITAGALAGAGEAVGEELGGDVGGIIGSFAGPILPALLKAPKTMITNLLNIAKAAPTGEQQAIIQAGKDQGLDVFTNDVVPADTFLGKQARSLSEKLGILGTGQARANQQIARQNIVEEIAKKFNIDINSDVTEDVVKSIKSVSAKKLEAATLARNEATNTFDQFGPVLLNRTPHEVAIQLRNQADLGALAEPKIVNKLEDTLSAARGARDFGVLAKVRSNLIDDILEARAAGKIKVERALQPVKSAIDKDMARFARQTGDEGRQAGIQWRAANREISKELETIQGTELARIFRGGTADPQKIAPILFSGKKQQLDRLAENTGKKGKEAIKATIVQDALRRSGFLKGDINPDRFATALKRPEIQRAVNKFFTGNDKKQLQGIGKVLDHTRRAQQAALSTETGQQLVPFAAGGTALAAFQASPLLTVGGATTLSALSKAYETPAFRSLMIKIANAKKDSIIEQRLLNQAIPGILAGLRQSATPQGTTNIPPEGFAPPQGTTNIPQGGFTQPAQ